MFGLVNCNASLLARQETDANLFFVRTLFKAWLWPIITCFGVTGNILAIIVLTKRRMITSSTNNYLIALALVDIAYLILTLILNTCLHPCFSGTSTAAILWTVCKPMADFSSNTSVWITVTFTIERWVAISYPLKSRTWCTVHRARKIILSVMLAAFLCTSPTAFEYKLQSIVVSIANNSQGKTTVKKRIISIPTSLGNNELYQKIYFNFVTFAIIWIPLLLLIIFNTILILYVHRSKRNEQRNSQGINLRRHNRSNQSEQRKTTVMLIAVVIVFTVCQIPQAISLTVQSFFPHLSQSSKVRIYNNFANCLVAINASMNFFLYCAFSERFRSTFSSHFAFISKYCMNYMDGNWKIVHDDKFSLSLDNMSFQSPPLNSRTSNISTETNQKYLKPTWSNQSSRRQSWFDVISKFHLNKRKQLNSNTETNSPNSPTTSLIKSPSHLSSNSLEEKRPLSSPVRTNRNQDSIWVKRRLSNHAIEQIFNRQKTFLWKEIIDVTV